MLIELINHFDNGNKSQFAKRIGITAQGISTWLSRNTFDSELIYSKCEGINAQWLLSGTGNMLIKQSPVILSQKINDNSTSIPLVDISVAAGCTGYGNYDYLEVIDNIQMPSSMVKKHGRYFCVRIKGESMTPTLLDSSYVIIRLLDRSEWGNIPEGHIYVVSDREGKTYIKRIKNRLKEHGFIVCMSDNMDKVNYPNFNLMEDEINTILHAEWYISAKMPNINETYYDKVNHLEDDIDIIKNQMNVILKTLSLKSNQ